MTGPIPRSLTKSTLERLAITDSRMSPGAAGGISRHVRRNTDGAATPGGSSGSGIVSAASYLQAHRATVLVSDYLDPTDSVDDTTGDYAGDFDPATRTILTDGVFQIAAWANVDTTDGTNARLSLDFGPGTTGDAPGARDSSVAHGGTAWMYCSAVPVELASGTVVNALWVLNDSDGTSAGTNAWGAIRVVRLA